MTAIATACLLALAAAPRNYVVIVGNNRGLGPGVAPLQFADDDAVHFAELMGPGAAELHLLTVMDRSTQRQHAALAETTQPPTRSALSAALAQVARGVSADAARGLPTQFYFVYVGHGGVDPDGEGYVSLLDGKLTRSDLFREVIAPSRATFNHVVIDACDSYYLVSSRGAGEGERGPDRSEAIRRYLSAEDLAAYPNTGVLVSTTGDRASHEWSIYRGGVFSHAVVSAMAGAADVNGDGAVDYSEIAAFLQAMSAGVSDPRARLDVYVRPPAQALSAPFWWLGGYQRFLRLGPALSGKFFVEGPEGGRFADFNKAPGATVLVALPSPRGAYALVGDGREAPLPEGPLVTDAASVRWAETSVAARADVASALARGLFQVPFGPAFYAGFVAGAPGFLPASSDAPPFLPSFAGPPPDLPLENPFAP